MRRIKFFAGVLALVVLASCTRVPDTLRVGVAQPLSGPFAAIGRDMLEGAQLAADELNAAGLKVDGQATRIELVQVDDRSDPAVGEAAARELVAKGVVGVIGHLNSGVTIQAAPIYAAAHVPQLAISTQPRYTELGLPTTFRLVANDRLQAAAIGAYAAGLDGRAYALIDDESSYGKALAEQAAATLAAKHKAIALRRTLSAGTIDFGNLVREIKAAQIDVLVSTAADSQIIALAKQLADIGVTGISIVGADLIKTDKLLDTRLPQRIFATSPVLEPAEFLRGKAFVEAFQAAYGHPPVYGAHYAYDAVHLLARAAQRAGRVDGQAVTRALRELDFVAPVVSTMKFGPTGDQLYGSVGVYRPGPLGWESLINSSSW